VGTTRAPEEGDAALIIVGRIRKAHGVRGDVVVEALTDDPDAVFAAGRRLVAGTTAGDPVRDGAELHIVWATPFKGGFIVHFTEIADRTVAEKWRDRFLLAPAHELSGLAEGEVYVHDLIGMRVELASGALVGSVADTYELPQGLALDVARGDGRGSVMIPYDRVVTSVDRDHRVIRIDPPAGLLDD
jgi:16S rRNA processing protein RimM